MDLNLYLGLPLLPRPPGRLGAGAAMDCPAPAVGAVPAEPPVTDDAPAAGSRAREEMPSPPAVVNWPSGALSTPAGVSPMLVDWLDGLSSDSEDTLDAASHDAHVSPPPPLLPPAAGSVSPVPEDPSTDEPAEWPVPEDMLPLPLVDMDSPMDSLLSWLDSSGTDSEDTLDTGELAAVAFDTSSDDTNASPRPPLSLAGLEGVHLEWVERLSRPVQAATAAATEMVSTRQSVGGAIEVTTPELRLQRLIQVSEQHRIVRPGSVSRNQRATSPEAERLAQAIQRSHSSLDASRRQNLDSDGKMGGAGAVKKDGSCGCNSSFECNICLDAAKEPVVTPCGHLFCWPCLYQWLHGHSVHSECPVCKGEVLEVNVTPIYGRGGGERDASSNDVPPRPSANRSESLRQQLHTPDPRVIANMVRRLIGNQDHLRGQAAPPTGGAEVPLVPEGGPTRVIHRVGVRRQPRPIAASPSFNSPSPLTRLVRRYAAPVSDNPVQLLSDNAAPAVPQDSSSVEQASTSSNVAVIVGQAAQSRGQAAPPTGGAELPLVPEGGRTRVIHRVGVRRQPRPISASPSINSPSPLRRLVRRYAAPVIDSPVQLPSDNAAWAVPQESSSVEQASTSSNVAVIVGQAAQSRRSRPPTEPTTSRRTRRRQQH